MVTFSNPKSKIQNPTLEEPERVLRPLPAERLEYVPAWGGASGTMGYVYRPNTIEGIAQVFELARQSGRTVGLRGAGNSYGDAAQNGENIVLDLRRMNRILAWEPESGRVTVEPGVTLQQLWRYVLEDGWWPPVSTGTMQTSLGGCAAMNVHGKNAWKVGPIGDHIYQFDLMLPGGEILTCSREQNSNIFHAAIGGFGMLGCFTSISLQMKRVYSGLLEVTAVASRNLSEMMGQFNEHLPTSDYVVGWIDAYPTGRNLGRGQVHLAHYLPPGADPNPNQTMRLNYQDLPDTLFGLVPRSIMWLFMRPFVNNLGWQFVNMGKYWASRLGNGKKIRQSHAAFHFLLDYVPNFKKSYGRDGLIQYQPFVPAANAEAAFSDILRLGRQRGLPNYLTVLKRHRPDNFLMTHGLDGYSLAMDFRVTAARRPRLARLAAEMDEIVLAAGGRFYFAKDSTLRPEVALAYLGTDTINRFRALKERCDPEQILETNLWRRIFG
jgi:decaprenylphospho-beta-D-ribofuranose 2-oxidase